MTRNLTSDISNIAPYKAQKRLLGVDTGPKGLSWLGVVEAGFPMHAEEDDLDSLTFDEYLIDNREASYILRVKGDSMIDAGIFEGDLVIVERGKIAKEGDIVIAQIDEQWTMKYYRCKAGKIYLAPANKNYPPLFPENSLSIVAIVKAVVRKYSN